MNIDVLRDLSVQDLFEKEEKLRKELLIFDFRRPQDISKIRTGLSLFAEISLEF